MEDAAGVGFEGLGGDGLPQVMQLVDDASNPLDPQVILACRRFIQNEHRGIHRQDGSEGQEVVDPFHPLFSAGRTWLNPNPAQDIQGMPHGSCEAGVGDFIALDAIVELLAQRLVMLGG